jgi:hypothetical protein
MRIHTSRFATLLRREWLQHGRGYLLLSLIPAGLMLLGIVIGWKHVQVQPGIPMLAMAISTLGVTWVIVALVCVAVLFQLPGLARRDMQDRSIEFWSSLPVSHTEYVAAPLVVHGFAMPLMALGIGFAASQVLGVLTVCAALGASALLDVPWAMLIGAEVAGLLRMGVGLVLAALWIAPIPLVLMVASAALKRWGVPVVVAGTLIAALVLEKVYGITVVRDTLVALGQHAGHAVLAQPISHSDPQPPIDQLPAMLGQLPAWAGRDAVIALRNLLSLPFAASLAASAACFAGLVALRRRAAGA